jgi:hypothetical protein
MAVRVTAIHCAVRSLRTGRTASAGIGCPQQSAGMTKVVTPSSPFVMAVLACTRTCSECHGHPLRSPLAQDRPNCVSRDWMPATKCGHDEGCYCRPLPSSWPCLSRPSIALSAHSGRAELRQPDWMPATRAGMTKVGRGTHLGSVGCQSSSSNGTMVDFTVFMAIACATASFTPSTVKGNSVCILRQGYLFLAR